MNTNPWIDITRPIYPGMPVWPGDQPVEERPLARIAAGDAYNLSGWVLGNHSGTHVDPPLHMLAGGKSVAEMDLESLCGPCRVLDLTHITTQVAEADLANAGGATRLLLKTPNSFADPTLFHEGYVALSLQAALRLVEIGVRLIGTDGPSIEQFIAPGYPIHQAILGAEIAVVEGLDLSNVSAGEYEVICAPLRWRNGDGSPCRTLLRRI